MRNLIEYILLHLVQHPDAIEIDEVTDGDFTEFTIHVHAEDIGRIIGRQGRTIQAIRTLAKVRAIQDDVRVRINIEDGEDRREAPREEDTALSQDEVAVDSELLSDFVDAENTDSSVEKN
jgi:predicted RNA-binding protein YlqC (UPF0109 family)